jgi:hypothetical protein
MKQLTNDIKEAYRLFFMVKGHLNSPVETVLASADSYFKRLWYDGCAGAPLYEYDEDFEKAWREKYDKQKNRNPK